MTDEAVPPIVKCNTLQHTATHCNTLQHTTTHYNTLQHTATVTTDEAVPPIMNLLLEDAAILALSREGVGGHWWEEALRDWGVNSEVHLSKVYMYICARHIHTFIY